ncbi:MAG: phosphodiesterase [Actinomycetota bacterium]|nr:MAG: phosphodiesterase [Actinomycetota bacterium]
MTELTALGEQLRTDIERSGYYPDLVSDSLGTALAQEPVTSYVVHHEATFDHDELRRHVTVLALTPTRLIVGHTDEHPADDSSPVPYATASTEAVRLDRVDSVVVTRVVAEPAGFRAGGPLRELVLTIGWGAVSRIDLEPASCGDPDCEADHGYTGTASNDDLSLRVSDAADGSDVVAQALLFAAALSAATGRRLA